ncbi:hypothetical protein [Roseobacter denitrificans]|uniref:hypothetical protein n=1 Tax=Roseobacter denitrificans TaxID=2434 RepID=UPI0002F1E9D3|nr:hypothetical protein [Roseobacter denitrificans]SFF94423.1 hypothetical protein SAMN05443635_104156 [Roseobacter denitrificans OCh 114]
MKHLLFLLAPLAVTACVGLEIEPVSVDDGADVGGLTLGTNTFVGQVSGTCAADMGCRTRPSGRDEFKFDVADGTAITAIRVSAVGTGPQGFAMKAVIKDLRGATERAPFLTGVTFPPNGQTRDGLVGFLDAGTVGPVPALSDYIMEVGTSDKKVPEGTFDVTYRLELDVQFVAPE